MNNRKIRPPRLAAWLLERTANRDEISAIVGDFTEEFREAVETRGIFRARLDFWRLVAVSLPSFLRDSATGSLDMLKNYLMVAVRNLRRHKGFSFINITGLAVGLAGSLLIAVFVRHELSFDRFHEKSDRIYRVGVQIGRGEGAFRGAFSAPPLADALKSEFPEVEQTARMSPWPRNYLIRFGDRQFLEKGLIFADGELFDIFTIEFLLGDPATALADPNTVVLTRTAALRYFGMENPLGHRLRFEEIDRDFLVTGLIGDCPAASHFRYTMIASLCTSATSRSTNWGSHTYFTYVTLREGSPAGRLEEKFPDFVRKHWGAQNTEETGISLDEYFQRDENYYTHTLEPLTAIHLNSEVTDQQSVKGNPVLLAVMSVVAFLILALAGINFMNLSTARFTLRAREVGIRKVLGSSRQQLIRQFLGESVLLSLTALCLAALIVALVLPAFSGLAEREISLGLFRILEIVPLLFGFAVAVGLLAGGYPALFLSSLRPVQTVKGAALRPGRRTLGLRRALVVLQFVVTAVVLFGTFVISRQVDFLSSRPLGFDKHHVLVIHRASSIGLDRAEAFKQDLLRHAAVRVVSHTDALPGRHFEPNGHRVVGQPMNREFVLQTMCADDDFADLIGLEIASGRYFSPERKSDADEVVINQTAARRLGFDDPLGERFYKTSDTYRTIVGVVRDFHFFSLHSEILPMAIRRWDGSRWAYTAVRLRPGPLKESIALLEKTWKNFTGGQPFEYSFLDADFDRLYRKERKTGRIFGIFAGLAVFIAGLGLFGLVSFAAEQRTREIGIRKVLGASPARIALLLGQEILLLVSAALVFALPTAAFFMRGWLQGFAYRVGIKPLYFVVTALSTLLIALIAMAFRAVRAATADPADALRWD